MKKLIKKLSVIMLAFAFMFSLVSCSDSISIYKEFNNAGSSLAKNHVFESISVKKIVSKVNSDKKEGTSDNKIYTYVFFGDSANAASVEAIQIYNEQAKQYNIEKVYYLNSDLSSSELATVKTVINMARSSRVPAIFVLINGELEFDSTLAKYDNTETISIASKAFKDTK